MNGPFRFFSLLEFEIISLQKSSTEVSKTLRNRLVGSSLEDPSLIQTRVSAGSFSISQASVWMLVQNRDELPFAEGGILKNQNLLEVGHISNPVRKLWPET